MSLSNVWERTSPPIRAYCGVVLLVLTGLATYDAARLPDEAVLNPAAAHNLSDWRAHAGQGELRMSRAKVIHGPPGITSAIDVRHRGNRPTWAYVVTGLRSPNAFFATGQTYRMRAYVRDLHASGGSIGMLLANNNFAHRPTTSSEYRRFRDRSWHLIQQTFTAARPAYPDTKVYFQLPQQPNLHWQITSVSVRRVQLPQAPIMVGGPSRRLTFTGARGSAPDSRVWSHEVGGHGWGNDELQAYTGGTANARVDGKGELVLTARREQHQSRRGTSQSFTSARLTTQGNLAIQPGSYVEASIQVPFVVGVRPAFWLLGANIDQAGWPACGELDVMETTRGGPSTVRQAIHTARVGKPSVDAPYGEFAPGGYTDIHDSRGLRSHRYGVYFDDKVVAFYIDGVQRLHLTREEALEKDRTWPFAEPQNVLLGLAVTRDTSAGQFPVSMHVSDIRVWSRGVPLPIRKYVPAAPASGS
jgi:Glycosyl hydrolases family 16